MVSADQTRTLPVSDWTRLEQLYEEKAARLNDAAELGAERELPPGLTVDTLHVLLRRYFWQEPLEQILERSPEELFEIAVSHFAIAHTRPEGSVLVRARTVKAEDPSPLAGRTIVEVVADDMPFLVDSVTAEISRQGRDLLEIVHPVLVVRRDITGVFQDLCDTSKPQKRPDDGLVESWMHLEIAEEPDSAQLKALEGDLRRVLADVRHAVEDWGKMRATVVRIARELESRPPVGIAQEDIEDAAELLRWLVDDNFVFLGYREYELSDDDALEPVAATGLGILRSDVDMASSARPLPEAAAAKAREPELLILTKADSRSTVHRPVYLDYIGVKAFDENGVPTRERRILGLLPSGAYVDSVTTIPVVRRKVAEVMARSGLSKRSHSGKDLLDILENYPRDELLQISVPELLPIALAVLHLSERRQTRLFLRRDPYGRFFSALVYLPRDRYTTNVRLAMQAILMETLAGVSVEYTAHSTESILARLHFVIRTAKGEPLPEVDIPALEARLARAARNWSDDLLDELLAAYDAGTARELHRKYVGAFSDGYKDDFPASEAVADIARLETLHGRDGAMDLALRTPKGAAKGERRFKVFRIGAAMTLSSIMPRLQHMGMTVTDERPYEVECLDGQQVWIYDFGLTSKLLEYEEPKPELLAKYRATFHDAFAAIWSGEAEDDGFNALVTAGDLPWRLVAVLRAYVRYLRQGGLTFSQVYIEQSLVRNVETTKLIVARFEIRFDPAYAGDREADEEAVRLQIVEELGKVSSLDEDRILSSLSRLVRATQRTNYYQATTDATGRKANKSYISFKFDPSQVPDLPEPKPAREIWVYSPRVEGVHLRFGAVARGGLRWSDRREDLRTEILGLVKAQTVKNTVIVPTGAKGGFVVRRPVDVTDRDAWLAEGIACYRIFIGALLDISDNLVEGKIRPPADVVRHDGDDTYLVVAADKGTATFSDIANDVAISYGFWLGDAFASGGSVGYDHKAMGITAKGAWESVKRHFRELAHDTQAEDFTVVGIGDMSGDVFGNGMLLSEHIKLVAAFDHRHIFIDPTPDPKISYAERQRLFDLPRSSWADYDTALISKGGGVWPRTAKYIPMSAEMRAALGIEIQAQDTADDVAEVTESANDDGGEQPADSDSALTSMVTPAQLMKAILLAPADLLWNGGIGTYVKASTENNIDVGDRANDAIRVDGSALCCKVVGEGGNLGCTQLGRIEYALSGGRINTDAIDNSAGVDTSDHEVNIKILLNRVRDDGLIDDTGRTEVLVEMTDEVAALVLADNYDQNAALANEAIYAAQMLDVAQRYIRHLVREGRLNRAIEFLPNDRVLAERARDGIGLTGPELSVLLAYSKIELADVLVDSELPDDPAVHHILFDYFPTLLRERYREQMDAHPLRREIVTTGLVNTTVNVAGITGVFRLQEESGAALDDLVRGHVASSAIFCVPEIWSRAAELDNAVTAPVQATMRLEATRLAERATRWLMMHAAQPVDIGEEISRYREGAAEVIALLPEQMRGSDSEAYATRRAELESAGVPAEQATRIATFPKAIAALDIVKIATENRHTLREVGEVYHFLADELNLSALLERIIALPRGGRWQAMSRATLRDDFNALHAELTADVLQCGGDGDDAKARFKDWRALTSDPQRRAVAMLGDISSGDSQDLATLVVAVRVLREMLARS
ncbi:MAG: NAD-glutamate dehydrogenase [Geodermatophilaceae bacterium]|nr:NAD-glutamate dehydrogenase [Geodermatophilaceae bacterium]